MKITAELLSRWGACETHLNVFCGLWPDGCLPSLEVVMQASRADLDLNFFARHVLSPRARMLFMDAENAAIKRYQKICNAAKAQFDHETEPARKVYGEALWVAQLVYNGYETAGPADPLLDACSWDQYQKATGEAWQVWRTDTQAARTAFRNVIGPAGRQCQDAKALALWEAWLIDYPGDK